MLANDIPSTFLTCNMQRKQVRQQTTPQYHSSFHGERLQNLYSSRLTELGCNARYISKVDCAGGKFKLLPEYLTERDI